MARIQAFIEPHTELGESPLYREADNTLHYVDVLGERIIILNLSGLHRRTIHCPEPVTSLAFHKDGGYIVCSFSSIVRVSDDGTWRILVRVIQDTTIERLNDGGIDGRGRLWVGSIDRIGEALPKLSAEAEEYHGKGSIYRYDPDGTLSIAQEGGVIAGNGLCWSPGNRTMYHVDSYRNVRHQPHSQYQGLVRDSVFIRTHSTPPRVQYRTERSWCSADRTKAKQTAYWWTAVAIYTPLSGKVDVC